MKKLNVISKIVIIVLYLIDIQSINAQNSDRPTEELIAVNPTIKVGEPIIIEYKFTYSNPQLDPSSNKTMQGLSRSDAAECVAIKDNQGRYYIKELTIYPTVRTCRDNKGLVYSSYFTLFYNKKTKKLIFDKPGVYTIDYPDRERDNTMFKPATIEVKPASEQEKKALSILTGESDLLILGLDSEYIKFESYPETEGMMERFKMVVEQCPDTMIAKMAAARLGIEETKEFEEKYGDEQSLEQYKNGEIEEPLFEPAQKHLNLAYQLPYGIPIREVALDGLTRVEYLNGNSTRLISLLDELITKYPQGKYGKRAIRGKQYIQEFIEKRPDLFVAEATQPQKKTTLGIALPIAGAAVAVIAIAGLILFSRKKKLNKS
ncbi:MAG: hypothetical protein JXA96_10145 [Sedimentisphaerales bacterium]|nr:hypothetical protein [Sedimentisphaerales bacterium]